MREYNPYTPGAGFRPTVLAGREKLTEQVDYALENLQRGYPQRSVVYYGLRGVGKTVLLNYIEDAADNRNMLHEYIEATEDKLFRTRLITALMRFVRQLSVKENMKAMLQPVEMLIRAFRVSYDPKENSFSAGLDGELIPLTGIFSDDLTEIIVQLGRAANKAEKQICLLFDEMQYLDQEDIAGLIGAIHRCNQLRLPVMMYCAGLPKIKKMFGDAKTYSERLFSFDEISSLDEESAANVITGPAEGFQVKYSDDAIQEIIRITGGYPYFLQEMCSTVWAMTDSKIISLEEVKSATSDFFDRLDRGFFAVRYERCSNTEKAFMAAMVKCGELPCTISNVATILSKPVKAISPVRGKLINKGLIYATGHAEIDFTVPQFDEFIKRVNPDLVLQ